MERPRIVLATMNARYTHAAFGLRYLRANMGALAEATVIREFTLGQRPLDVVEALLAEHPTIVGIGVYIWNVAELRQVVALLRAVAPEVTVVVGGPEVSFEIDAQPWLADVDYVVRGEGDLAFASLCRRLVEGRRPLVRIIDGGTPPVDELQLPYALYDEEDLAHRVVYVEASRGCPYRCEFCLSSLDQKVRAFELETLLRAFDDLLDRGCRRFKFVDRTFNLNMKRSAAILEHFLDWLGAHPAERLFLHFEMVPDRLPEGLRGLLQRFPAGAVQLEVGIQSFDPEVGARIQRRQDTARTLDNLAFLREHTGVHLHTDLIIGLPGESVASFGAGLDRLIDAGVQEVQVGVLKRLRGTPIARHAEAFDMVFEPDPPYAILRTRDIDFDTMLRLRRFALVWDVFWNRGDFLEPMRALWGTDSPFETTLAFSDWLHERFGRVHGVSLARRAAALAERLADVRGLPLDAASAMVERALVAAGRRGARGRRPKVASDPVPARQRRHLSP